MPCILKQKTDNSPGIITFTHNEVLRGVIFKSAKVRAFLNEQAKTNQWVFGVHIQGNCSYLNKWPLQKWQSFIMWPDKEANFLHNVPKSMILNMCCVNFMPDQHLKTPRKKVWDICILSRPSSIKRIVESLYIIRKLMDKKPDLKVLIMVHDTRDINKGDKTYEHDNVERKFFELPLKLFSAEELKNLCFISSSTQSFGRLPLSEEFIWDMISRSRFVLLTSHREGTPRVLAEALQLGAICIVSKNLRCGIENILDSNNTLYIDDEFDMAASQILAALRNYSNFHIDRSKMKNFFSGKKHINELRRYLNQIIRKDGLKVEGKWYLEDLHLRLAGHGQKYNFQFIDNEKGFFYWFNKINDTDPYDEDSLWVNESNQKNKYRFFLERKINKYFIPILIQGRRAVKRAYNEVNIPIKK